MKRFLSALLVSFLLLSVFAAGAFASESVCEFDPNEIRSAVFLSDPRRALGFGHSAILLIDANGAGIYYNYTNSSEQQRPFGIGATDRFLLSPEEVTQALQSGTIAGDERGYLFNRMIRFDVLPEEGLAMFEHAESINFRFYNVFASIVPIGDQCDTLARNILAAGGRRFRALTPFGIPAWSFHTLQWRLTRSCIEHTVTILELD